MAPILFGLEVADNRFSDFQVGNGGHARQGGKYEKQTEKYETMRFLGTDQNAMVLLYTS